MPIPIYFKEEGIEEDKKETESNSATEDIAEVIEDLNNPKTPKQDNTRKLRKT